MNRSPTTPGLVEWLPLPETGQNVLRFTGDWTLPYFAELESQLDALKPSLPETPDVDFNDVGRVDTAGAGLIAVALGPKCLHWLAEHDHDVPRELRALLGTVSDAVAEIYAHRPPPPRNFGFVDMLADVGTNVVHVRRLAFKLLGFIGATLETLARTVWRPRRWRITALVANMEQTGLHAVPIVALLSFLIGAVIAFLGATALQRYGATVFTVDLVSYAFLRELELLVLPRVLALVIVTPLLAFLAVMAGVVGGALVCWFALDITPTMFISVFQTDTPLRYLWLGLGKAPVFAFLIAVIGCLEGFKVQGSAQSVGERTTSSVVQSIFLVIVVDALAALFFMEMNW